MLFESFLSETKLTTTSTVKCRNSKRLIRFYHLQNWVESLFRNVRCEWRTMANRTCSIQIRMICPNDVLRPASVRWYVVCFVRLYLRQLEVSPLLVTHSTADISVVCQPCWTRTHYSYNVGWTLSLLGIGHHWRTWYPTWLVNRARRLVVFCFLIFRSSISDSAICRFKWSSFQNMGKLEKKYHAPSVIQSSVASRGWPRDVKFFDLVLIEWKHTSSVWYRHHHHHDHHEENGEKKFSIEYHGKSYALERTS